MGNKLLHIVSKVISNRKVAENIFLLRIKDHIISRNAEPGNFIFLKIEGKTLRRPFSIFNVKKGYYFEILYKIVGSGTEILSMLKKEQRIDYIGPLGNSFPVLNKNPVFLAGGIGVAPVYFLAKRIHKEGIFVYGVKREKEFVNFSLKHRVIRVSEEKDKKKVTDFLSLIGEDNVVYVAGNKQMIKKVLFKLRNKNVAGYFSWEERMGCGIGVCRSCVIMTRTCYKRTCKEGPVFSFDEIDVKKI